MHFSPPNFNSLSSEISSHRPVLHSYSFVCFLACHPSGGLPKGLCGKESTCQAGDACSISGSGRSPAEGNGNPLQYSCLENLMNKRSLAGYSPWGRRVGHNLVIKQQQQQQHLSGIILGATIWFSLLSLSLLHLKVISAVCSFPLVICLQERWPGRIVSITSNRFNFNKKCPNWFPEWLYHFSFLPECIKISFAVHPR